MHSKILWQQIHRLKSIHSYWISFNFFGGNSHRRNTYGLCITSPQITFYPSITKDNRDNLLSEEQYIVINENASFLS